MLTLFALLAISLQSEVLGFLIPWLRATKCEDKLRPMCEMFYVPHLGCEKTNELYPDGCRKTCGLCADQGGIRNTVGAVCSDKEAWCRYLPPEKCDDFYYETCSCTCKAHSVGDKRPVCEDLYGYCARIAHHRPQRCQDPVFSRMCRFSCRVGPCGDKKVRDARPREDGCDFKTQKTCDLIESRGMCNSVSSQQLNICETKCGFCDDIEGNEAYIYDEKRIPPEPTPEPDACRDEDPKCIKWANHGGCTYMNERRRNVCRMSCGECTPFAVSRSPPALQAVVENSEEEMLNGRTSGREGRMLVRKPDGRRVGNSGTRFGPRSGPRSGTRSGSRSGTRSGTRSGKRSGTRSDPRRSTLRRSSARRSGPSRFGPRRSGTRSVGAKPGIKG